MGDARVFENATFFFAFWGTRRIKNNERVAGAEFFTLINTGDGSDGSTEVRMRPIPAVEKMQRSAPAVAQGTGRRYFLIILYVATFVVLATFLIYGFSYYTTPYSERPHHPDYRQLRPAGTWGLLFGVVGALMMIVMLVYSVRKRSKFLRRVGKLPTWLDLHIYLGIAGPLFIVLHTSFKVEGLVAVSFWSMLLVALSGYFGRYLYIQIPRNIQGKELTLQELEDSNRSLNAMLRETYDLDEAAMKRLDELATVSISDDIGLCRALALSLKSDLHWLASSRVIRKEYARIIDLPKHQLGRLLELTRERYIMQRRVALLSRAQQLFHYWHVVHKPFAIVMYVVMAIHITVAIWTGYARIL